MSQPEAKRVKTDDNTSSPEYTLIYWPGIPGRGEFIRLLFEESSTPYTDLALTDSQASVKTITTLASKVSSDEEVNPPIFACPVLKHKNLQLSQTPNILLYLAPKLGLAPSPDSPEADDIYHLNAIALTILDGLSNEPHETHHPVGTALYYEDQKPEAKRRAKSFIDERLPKFLAYVQRLLDAKTSGEGPWLYGGKLTYVDLVLYQGLDGTTFAFPKTMEKLRKSGKYDGVFALYDAVQERPNIKEYLASGRKQQYSQGIWRHYPELEEE